MTDSSTIGTGDGGEAERCNGYNSMVTAQLLKHSVLFAHSLFHISQAIEEANTCVTSLGSDKVFVKCGG